MKHKSIEAHLNIPISYTAHQYLINLFAFKYAILILSRLGYARCTTDV